MLRDRFQQAEVYHPTWEATMVQFLSGAGLGIVGAIVLFRAGSFAFRRR